MRAVRAGWHKPTATKGKTVKKYLNWKGPNGRETVDEFSPEAGQTRKEFRAYVRKMVSEYHMAGMAVYVSSRPCKGW